MIQFLATQSVLDILSGRAEAQAWLDETALRSVEASSVSIGQALHRIKGASSAGQQRGYERALVTFTSAMQIHQGIVPFDENAAHVWATLMQLDLPYRNDGDVGSLSVASRMVVASAISRDATLIEGPQPYHARLPGLQVKGFV